MHDPNTEQFLRRLGVTFTFREKLPFLEIDMIEARANPARAHRAIDDETVLKYALAMQRGDDFRAILVIKRSTNRQYILATGLHRIIAASEWVKPNPIRSLDAYIADCRDDAALEALVIHAANSIEGKATTHDEDLDLAAECKRLYPHMSNREIAAAFDKREQTLANYLHQQEGEVRAHRLRCDGQYGSLTSQKLKIGLNRIQNDNIFTRATMYAFEAKIAGAEGDEFISDVLKCRTEKSAGELIDKRHDKLRKDQAHAKAVHGRTPRTQAELLNSRSKAIIKGASIAAVIASIQDSDAATHLAVYEEAAEKLGKVIRIVRARVDANVRKATTVS